jgi:hypothetical protein
MASLQVEVATESVALDAGRSASVNFTVTNGAETKISALLRPLPGGAAREEWFTLAGETSQSMEPGESIVATVRILVPPGASTGEASLRLRATNENDANNDWADSAGCTFTIPAEPAAPPPPPPPLPAPPPKPKNLVLWIAVALLALALVVGAVYLWKNRGGQPPDGNGPTEAPDEPKSPPTLQPVSRLFIKPRIGSYRLDWCLTWGNDCGKPAADKFCNSKNFGTAKSYSIDENIGSKSNPTKTVGGDAAICDEDFCDGFKSIQCNRRRVIIVPSNVIAQPSG